MYSIRQRPHRAVCPCLQVIQASDDEQACLHVLAATRQDSGLYEARVQNELGSDVSTFSVIVLGMIRRIFSAMSSQAVCVSI